jgi:hypothetical protein
MKKVLVVLAAAMSLMGCRSGMMVAGPTSYWNAGRCDAIRTERVMGYAEEQQMIQPAKKEQVLKAVNIGMSSEQVIPAMGVNLTALFRNSYSAGEVMSQVASIGVDAAFWFALFKGGEAVYSHYNNDSGSGGGSGNSSSSSSSSQTSQANTTTTTNTRGDSTGNVSPMITGDNNTVQYNFGQGRTDNDGNGNVHQ